MKIYINGESRDATSEEQAEILAAQTAMTQPASSGDVNRERDRRVSAGTTVELDGYGPVPLQGRDQDQTNLLGLVTAASLRLAGGDNTTVTKFRDALNVDHMLVPSQIVEMWSKGSAWISDVYDASWTIKAMDPIPADYAADSYWPVTVIEPG